MKTQMIKDIENIENSMIENEGTDDVDIFGKFEYENLLRIPTTPHLVNRL